MKPSPTNGRRASRLDTDRCLRAGITSDEPRRTLSLKAEKWAETVQLEPIMDVHARLGESASKLSHPRSRDFRQANGPKREVGGGGESPNMGGRQT